MIWTTRQRSDLGHGLAGIVAGDGPRVILLHGVGLRAEAWAPQIDAMSRSHQVLAVDLPGHGDSDAGPGTLAEFATRLMPLLDQPAVVAGHSFGAMLTAELARRAPDKVRGVALLNAIYRRDAAAAQAVQARATALDGHGMADPGPTLTRWFGAAPSTERAACEHWLSKVDPAGYRAAYRVFASEDGPSDRTLDTLAVPALFMTGADEPNSTPAMSRAMAALAPKGRAVVLPGAAHMMPMTHPADTTAELETLLEDCA